MKIKNHKFDILAGFIVLTFVSLYFYNRYTPPVVANVAVKPLITKANDILRKKAFISPSSINTTATSSACTLFLKTSAELSMNDFANEYIDHHIDEILKTCLGAFPNLLQQKIEKALLECKSSTREKISKECYFALTEAKSLTVATIINPDTDPQSLPASILLHLISHKFMTNDIFEHPLESLRIIDELLDKEPNYLGGHKVKLALLAMSSLNKEDRYKDMFQETLSIARELNLDDPEINEIELFAKKDNKDFLKYLDEKSAQHPKDFIYDYYKASTLYDEGKGSYEETVSLIESALKKAPSDKRLKQTLENLKSDDEQKRQHPFTLSIGFTLDDL